MQRLNSRCMKLRLIYTDLCLKRVFENPTLCRNASRFSVVNSGRCLLQLPLTVSDVFPSKIRPNNSSRAQTFTLCTISFIQPHKEKSNSLNSRDLAGQLWGSPRLIHRTAKRSLRTSLTAHENEVVLRHSEFMRPRLFNIASFKIWGNSSRGNQVGLTLLYDGLRR
jgi:hypothetical protein